jgi:hypothetical protein
VIAAGLAGTAWAIGRWGTIGGGCRWGNNNFYVNHRSFNNINAGGWQHNAVHRQGVKYNNANVANRFAAMPKPGRVSATAWITAAATDQQGLNKGAGDRAATAQEIVPVTRPEIAPRVVIDPRVEIVPVRLIAPKAVTAPKAAATAPRAAVIVPRAVAAARPIAAAVPWAAYRAADDPPTLLPRAVR